MRRAPDLQWRCLVAGSHRTTCGRYSAIRVTLDDGDWWLTVYPDGSSSMPTERLVTAKRWADDHYQEVVE
jgi:hypothetical protein